MADYSCMYSSHALLHNMKEEKDRLLTKIEDPSYKFPPVEDPIKVSTRTNEIGRKFYEQYWDSGG